MNKSVAIIIDIMTDIFGALAFSPIVRFDIKDLSRISADATKRLFCFGVIERRV
jgi:hypothetical protein